MCSVARLASGALALGAVSLPSLAAVAEAAPPGVRLRQLPNGATVEVEVEAVRAGLARELEVPVVLSASGDVAAAPQATLDMTWRAGGQSVDLVFRSPDGREALRTVELPADPALARATLVFAMSNLVRDEAATLLPGLRPRAPVLREPISAVEPAASPTPPVERRSAALDPCATGPLTTVGADLFPFVGSSSFRPDEVRVLSGNLVGGYSRGLRGLELGVGANVESAFMCGVQIAAGGNVVTGPARGLQLALFDITIGRMEGAQVAVGGLVDGDLSGFQLAVVGIVTGSVTGAQIAPVNLAVAGLSGVQLGTVNLVRNGVRGAQLGVVNIAAGDVRGVQLGAGNFASGAVSGPQLGLANYADDVDYPVGLVSVVRRGATDVRAWTSDSGVVMGGVRHGGRVVRNTYGLGYDLRDRVGAVQLGIGVDVPLAPRLHLEAGVAETWMLGHHPGLVLLSTAQVAFDYAITPTTGVFAGPTFSVLVSEDKEQKLEPLWGSIHLHEWDSGIVRGWPGVTLGFRASL